MKLTELIVAIMVFTIIMVSVTSVFAPMLRAYSKANNLAEANTILDNTAALIMDDIAGAVAVAGLPGISPASRVLPGPGDGFAPWEAELVINGSPHRVEYRQTADGLQRRTVTASGGEWRFLLEPEFYRHSTIDMGWDFSDGLVTITLRLISNDGWFRERIYMARPVGLGH